MNLCTWKLNFCTPPFCTWDEEWLGKVISSEREHEPSVVHKMRRKSPQLCRFSRQSEWRNSDSVDQESAAKRPFDLLEPSERTSFHSWHMERQCLCCVRCKGRFPCWISVSWQQRGQKFTKSHHFVFFGTDNRHFGTLRQWETEL